MPGVEGKSAALAVVLSFIVPGLGHFYLGSSGKGIMFIVLDLIGWGLCSTIVGAILGIPMLLIVLIWAMVDAYQVAK